MGKDEKIGFIEGWAEELATDEMLVEPTSILHFGDNSNRLGDYLLQLELYQMLKYPKLRTKDDINDKVDVIVCAKDSILTLGLCLSSLVRQRDIGKIVVVHPHSDKITPFIAKGFPRVITVKEPPNYCLAWARKLGVKYTSSKWVAYVDADIILGKDHLYYIKEMCKIRVDLNLTYTNQTLPVAIEGILTKKRMMKSILPLARPYSEKIFKKGERGFTHNTVFNRETLESWNPQFTHAYEDWLLTQHVISNGGDWIRVRVPNIAYNLQDYDLFTRVAWASAGERIVKKMNFRSMVKRVLKHLIRSIKFLVMYRNLPMFLEQIVIAIGRTHGYFKWDKHMGLQRPQRLQHK